MPRPEKPTRGPSEIVGPDESREDVSGQPDRALVLRAVHEVLCVRHDFKMFKIGIGLDLEDIKSRLKPISIPPGPPPMRPKADSVHTVVERASESFERTLSERARATPGPTFEATPAEVARLAKEAFAEEVRLAKVAADQKRLAELDEAERLAKADRHKLKMKFYGAIAAAVGAGIVGVASAVATYGARAVKAESAIAKEREIGRAEGRIESSVSPPTAAAPSSSASPKKVP